MASSPRREEAPLLEGGPPQRDDFEDNLPQPSRPWMSSLRGCVQGRHPAPVGQLSSAWFYQRFVNVTMQCFTQKDAAWYEVQVDGGDVQPLCQNGWMAVPAAVLLSPVTFPVVYGFAVVYLSLFWLSFVDREGGRANAVLRVIITILKNAWYCFMSSLPWVFIYFGDYECFVGSRCEAHKAHIHLSKVAVYSPWVCCMMAAFQFTRGVKVSACDCACEGRIAKMINRDHEFGPAINETITKLSDPADEFSYFPVYVSSEHEEPAALPNDWSDRIFLFVVPLIHALLPDAWMVLNYGEQWIPVEPWVHWELGWQARMTSLVAVTAIIGPYIEVYNFLSDFHMAIEQFQDVVDQLMIFVYICSKSSTKQQALTQTTFRKSVSENDEYRQTFSNIFKAEKPNFRCFDKGENRWVNYEPTDELSGLKVHRVAFNMKRIEGVKLFRLMRKWLCTDILNERMEVEIFITLSTVFFIVSFVFLVGTYMKYQELTAVWTILPFDIVVILFMILRGLDVCIKANEYLFEHMERLLLDWQDEAVNPETSFGEEGDGCAIGWVWDVVKQRPKAMTYTCKTLEPDNNKTAAGIGSTSRHVQDSLSITIQRINKLEAKQRILGFEVTKELRNRLLASLGTGLVALLTKLPSLYKEHIGEVHQLLNKTGVVGTSL